jgi:hypothetical protein
LLSHFARKELLSFVDVIVRASLFFLVAFIDVVAPTKERAIAKTGLGVGGFLFAQPHHTLLCKKLLSY